jgi:hypothetical protein
MQHRRFVDADGASRKPARVAARAVLRMAALAVQGCAVCACALEVNGLNPLGVGLADATTWDAPGIDEGGAEDGGPRTAGKATSASSGGDSGNTVSKGVVGDGSIGAGGPSGSSGSTGSSGSGSSSGTGSGSGQGAGNANSQSAGHGPSGGNGSDKDGAPGSPACPPGLVDKVTTCMAPTLECLKGCGPDLTTGGSLGSERCACDKSTLVYDCVGCSYPAKLPPCYSLPSSPVACPAGAASGAPCTTACDPVDPGPTPVCVLAAKMGPNDACQCILKSGAPSPVWTCATQW